MADVRLGSLGRLLVNSRIQARGKVKLADKLLGAADTAGIRTALEVGCGAGYVSAHLNREHGLDVTGIDVDPAEVDVARRKHGGGVTLRFSVADGAALPFEDGSFDLVVMQNALHHIGEWRAALGEAARVLAGGGYLLLTDLAVTGPEKGALAVLTRHHHTLPVEQVVDRLEEAGMQVAYRRAAGRTGGARILFRKAAPDPVGAR